MLSWLHSIPLNLRKFDRPRSPGIHLSGCLQVMGRRAGILKDLEEDGLGLDDVIRTTPHDEVSGTGQLMRVVLGYAWEGWLGPHLTRVELQPGEMCVDGIYMTPDGMEVTGDAEIIAHEIKCTAKSPSKPVTDSTLWMWQAASYIHGFRETYGLPCNKVVFHPLHRMAWDTPYIPQVVQFEDAEIKSVWQQVKAAAKEAIPEQ